MAKLLVFAFCIVVPLYVQAQEGVNNYLDVETPKVFYFASPLRQPESLRSPQYFDFLSTLYRRDATKADLFRPYVRPRRAIANDAPLSVPLDVSLSPVTAVAASGAAPLVGRPRRAILFRPLFVYKQQQIRREQSNHRRRV
ncbi:PREDICTED: uncharacterized protein LOC108373690 [Rhagoletis zephyria]|uniref:uncharacterized protein LOC108373690 n=1 Tax=Rhagoletis zephyria TaxID=28612 RepID=UPI0008117F66|nr:PREDICTED: uncharacterized protein LOC108373690 [Rhagoletis zephyria]